MDKNWSEIMALLTVAGFAVQRILELLDPLFYWLSKIVLRMKADLDEKTVKSWLMNTVAILLGWLIASIDDHQLPLFNSTLLSDLVLALAISVGTNAANSLLKYGEHAKEARKIEVQPLPEIKITPASTTVSKLSSLSFLASVTGTDNKNVEWRILETSDGGTIDSKTGVYTAPNKEGIYHVAAVSEANPEAMATATVTVK
jgi:hypothetical protein